METAAHSADGSKSTASGQPPLALVTGSAVGIGRALCKMFAARGYVVVGLDIDERSNEECRQIVGAPMTAVTCDVGDAAAVKEVVDAAARMTGSIDVLVNNAALWNDTTLLGGSFTAQTRAFRQAFDACAMGAFHCTAAAVAAMGPGANVVNMITEHIRMDRLITGLVATGYDGAKFTQWRLTESWAAELAPRGIRVNGLAFGATDTPMLRAVSVAIAEKAMHAQDMAEAVLAIIEQGPNGATGKVYDVGFSGTPREESLREIAAIRR